MASKKDQAAGEAVLEYLATQNRPYSVNDIVLNLHKEHGKAAIQKGLEKLVLEEKVREKTYGKQKVYLINQAGLPESTTDELKAMDALIESKEKNLRVLEVRLKEAQAELRAVNAQMPTVDAEALLDQVTRENAELIKRFETCSTSNVEVLDKTARDNIRFERARLLGEWRLRKQMCMRMVDGAMEGWPGSLEELCEQSNIELDEEVGAVMPQN